MRNDVGTRRGTLEGSTDTFPVHDTPTVESDCAPTPSQPNTQPTSPSGIPHSTFHIPYSPYPSSPSDRTPWITTRRGPKNILDPTHAYASLWEEEPDAGGNLAPTATVFLTNRECPYRCLMCDLWRNTLNESVPTGIIPAQLVDALLNLKAARQIKLYNAGSFFDPAAIPIDDYPAIAQICAPYERVIVECHPALIGPRVLDFQALLMSQSATVGARWKAHTTDHSIDNALDVPGTSPARDLAVRNVGARWKAHAKAHSIDSALEVPGTSPAADAPVNDLAVAAPRLEIAIGLETANPDVLGKLNKRFTLDDFRRAAEFLKDHDIDLRVFVLLRPPFMTEREGVDWAKRSIDFAFDCGATVVCVIPTRDGNGAMEALRESGEWSPPSIKSLEEVQEYGVGLKRGRVFADLWDIERFYVDEADVERRARISTMNQTQLTNPIVGQASLPVS